MSYSTFLHNHPDLARRLGLDEDHVIIDRKEWEEACEILANYEREQLERG